MSIQSDAAKAHIETLLRKEYDTEMGRAWRKEHAFHPFRKWRFDYAVPSLLCAKPCSVFRPYYHLSGRVLELDGGTFQGIRSGHSSGVGLRNWREKNNAAMSAGWRVWHYAPEEVIKAGRKRYCVAMIVHNKKPMSGNAQLSTMPYLRNPAR